MRADEPQSVAPALAALEEARAQGRFAAGYFAYELGYALEPRLTPLMPRERPTPLLWFGIFDRYEEVLGRELTAGTRVYASPLDHEWRRDVYDLGFRRVHQYIAAGDVYQVNLSFRSRFRVLGDPLTLWLNLRRLASVTHGAYVDDGERQVLSLSPELFFQISSFGTFKAKPMKGTTPRAPEASADAAARAHLAMSIKDRAENLMIVDLLRNDIGRIAKVGSIAVENLFEVETYPTLHTMVSTVTAELNRGTSIADLIRALFPCGSVTGAPKIRAMEIIRELEASPRGIYCGAIGYFAPDGSACFNVAIRTLTVQNGEGELGIGGGVVWDSRSDLEYDECLLKAQFYETIRRPLKLIETLRFETGNGFVRLDRHLERMAASAEAFAIPFHRPKAEQVLRDTVGDGRASCRVRLTLDETGEFEGSAAQLEATAEQWTFAISPLQVNSADALLRHKTSWREMYEEEVARLSRETGCDEVVFLNERGEVTEGSRSNVFVRINGKLCTPPQGAGLLNGCLRQELLAAGACEERTLRPFDLENHETFFGNSLRGLIPAQPVRAA